MGKTAASRFLGCFLSDPFHTCRYYNDDMEIAALGGMIKIP